MNVEREINVVVEQNPSVKKTKLMQIKRTVAKSIIKKVFLILFVSIFLFSCEKDGKDLSEKFCVNLVRNNWSWSCDKGAHWSCSCSDGFYNHRTYTCNQGDEGDIMILISGFFADGIDIENSYYRNHILHLENTYGNGSCKQQLTVSF